MTTPNPKPPLRLRSLVKELRRELKDCRRILEIGCGVDSPAQYLAREHEIEGLDIHEPSLKACMEKGFLKACHLAGALEIDRLFEKGQFDACVALDLIEHLEKADGEALIEKMARVASKRILLFTPNGFVPQRSDENPWMEHKSGWTTEDFRAKGFRVSGINGWKPLRGEYARLRYKPRWAWGMVSELTHFVWTRAHPQSAFSLLAVKDRM